MIRRSVKIRASTGYAVTDIETPRNSAKFVNGISRLEKIGYSSNARSDPIRKGVIMLAWEIATVA